MVTKKLTDDQIADCMGRIAAGTPVIVLADQYRVTSEAIHYHRRLAGLAAPTRPRLTDSDLAEATRRINLGESVRDVAASLGVARNTLYGRYARQQGRARRRHQGGTGIRRFDGRWAATITMPLDPAILGYLAGIIDGEGSLTPKRNGQFHVKVAMTDDDVCPWLAEIIGGSLSKGYPDGGRLPCWYWGLARRSDVHTFLVAIRPYMRITAKTARADAAIAASA